MKKSLHRIEKGSGQSLRNWEKMQNPSTESMKSNSFCEMGWGRLVFAHTFDSTDEMVAAMCGANGEDTRDIAIYVIDPHVAVSKAPDRLFLDPSHTFRIWHYDYQNHKSRQADSFRIQRVSRQEEAEEVNRIYAACHMKGAPTDFITGKCANRLRTYLVARNIADNRIIGTVTGVDHVEAFNDPEGGASLWSLAVDPQVDVPGVGITLVRHLVEHYFTKGRSFVDVSVMYTNQNAIKLYEKLRFQRIPAFCIKRKNSINEHLYTPPPPDHCLNPYARLIVDEARKRGIFIEVIDSETGLFKLTLGGRSISCRESLSEMTSAVAVIKCDDKRLTRKLVAREGIQVPRQIIHESLEDDVAFMKQVGRVVVKPARGEQGQGISVDISRETELAAAVKKAADICDKVLLESFVEGADLRVIVINHEVVAAALRKPPVITGTGHHSIKLLIEKYNRRRMAATGGESRIPDDGETRRYIREAGYDMDSILEKERSIVVRKTANLHTGGTIHDVTETLSDTIRAASLKISRVLEIPVTGLDFIVPDEAGDTYAFIEANERPGLANHEPRPTAERFIDFLFPETI